jgi:hypothetical protein
VKKIYSEFHAIPTVGAAATLQETAGRKDGRTDGSKSSECSDVFRRAETLQRRAFGRPAGSASSHVRTFVLIMKGNLWRNRNKVADVNMVHVNVKVKVKVTPEQATKAQRGNRAMAVLFL